MQTEYITRVKITANEGMVLTDGKEYGEVLFLANDKSPYDFYEITVEEYQRIMEEQEKQNQEENHGA